MKKNLSRLVVSFFTVFIGALSLAALASGASADCFTESNGMSFSGMTPSDAVGGCENTAGTYPIQCQENVRCGGVVPVPMPIYPGRPYPVPYPHPYPGGPYPIHPGYPGGFRPGYPAGYERPYFPGRPFYNPGGRFVPGPGRRFPGRRFDAPVDSDLNGSIDQSDVTSESVDTNTETNAE